MATVVKSAAAILADIEASGDLWALPDTDPTTTYRLPPAEHGASRMWNSRCCKCPVCIAAGVASRAAYRQARKDRRVLVARLAAALLRPDDASLPGGA